MVLSFIYSEKKKDLIEMQNDHSSTPPQPDLVDIRSLLD